jgi:beta-N-acetylhexosaminidase
VGWVNEARLTRRRLLGGIGSAAIAAGLAGCGSSAKPAGAPSVTAAPASPSQSAGPTPTPSAKPSPTAIDDAALRRKIASLLVVGFRGETVASDDWIMRAIADGLGGVILFDQDQLTKTRRNIASPSQVTTLIRTLKKAAPGRLIVSVDQEGGQIARLNPGDGFAATKSQADIGAANSTATTRAWAQGLVHELTSVGFNLNFAPVVDLNINRSNPAIGALDRSFSANPDVVVACATEEIKVHRSAGVRTVLKHFPGLGSATGNTDFGVVDVSKTWKPIELEPYQKLIKADSVDSIMAAHVLNHQLDPKLPASLSHAVVHDLLRVKLGWTGPVVSDDMQAVAISSKYGRSEATTMAVEAGVDMLVFANQETYNTKIVSETIDTVLALVHSGKVTLAQINQSVARVDQLRP